MEQYFLNLIHTCTFVNKLTMPMKLEILPGPTNSRSRKQVKKLMKLPKIVLAELVQNYEACYQEASQKH